MSAETPITTDDTSDQPLLTLERVRRLCAGILVIAAVTVLWLMIPLVVGGPEVVEASPGEATVRFEVDRPVTGSDGCFTASWAVEGVQTVQFGWFFDRPEGVIGQDSRILCVDRDSFVTLTVTLPDNAVHIYQINTIVSTAKAAPVYLLTVLGLLALAGVIVRAPDRLLTPSTQFANRERSVTPVEWGVIAALLLIVFVAYLPAKFMVYGGDYEVHVYYAHQIFNGDPITSPHFVNQLLMMGLAPLLPGDTATPDVFFDAQFWANQLFLLLTIAIFYGFLRYLIGPLPGAWGAIRLGALALGTMIAAPIFFPTLPERNLFMGYIPSSNMFHNPTYTLMRPMAVALVWIAVRMFRGEIEHKWLIGGAGAALVVLSLITKPNHVIVFVPAVGLLLLWTYWRERWIAWQPTVFIAAALPVMAIQFAAFFTDADVQRFTEPSQVIFAPFAAMLTRETSYGWMLIKLLLSSAFPLAVAVGYFSKARRDIALQLTWAAYGVGLVFAYFLAEAGKIQHANFIFSAQAGLDMLMLASVAWFMRKASQDRDGRWLFGLTLLVLHIAAGVIWHAVNVASGYGFYWWG